jgi:Flp pilus assembly protein TadG
MEPPREVPEKADSAKVGDAKSRVYIPAKDRTAGLPNMMKLLKILKTSRGQSLAELALVTPVILLLVLGAVDFGRAYFAHVSVTNAARNGADYAAQNDSAAADTAGIREVVMWEMSELVNTSGTNPEVTVATGTDTQDGDYAEVTVTYEFSTLVPWPGLPDSIDVARTVRSKVAQ